MAEVKVKRENRSGLYGVLFWCFGAHDTLHGVAHWSKTWVALISEVRSPAYRILGTWQRKRQEYVGR